MNEAPSMAYDAPVAPSGRDLRMTLTVKAFATGDQLLCSLIDRAVQEIQTGTMYVGKSAAIVGDNARSYARVELVGYQQTWDGMTDQQERFLEQLALEMRLRGFDGEPYPAQCGLDCVGAGWRLADGTDSRVMVGGKLRPERTLNDLVMVAAKNLALALA
jgi:hypothetical protein